MPFYVRFPMNSTCQHFPGKISFLTLNVLIKRFFADRIIRCREPGCAGMPIYEASQKSRVFNLCVFRVDDFPEAPISIPSSFVFASACRGKECVGDGYSLQGNDRCS